MKEDGQPRGTVLVVDDDPDLCRLLATVLSQSKFQVRTRSSAEAAFAAIEEDAPDLVITDLQMGEGHSGTQLCAQLHSAYPDLPVMVMTAFASVEAAVDAMRAGAEDFVTKPIRFDALEIRLDKLLQKRALQKEVKRLRRAAGESPRFVDLLGQSPPMQRLYALLDQIASSNASLLITGESGTGKELAARAVHTRSRRSAGKFLAINCAALPAPLLESELFGHAKGAFTDAHVERRGLLAQANGGTLFLDEIGELPLQMQPKLLRALQEKRVRPVGSNEEQPFDARIITATNVDLEKAISEGRFREDLFFRLNVIHVLLPPLRSRGSDVLLIAQHFVEQFASQAAKRVTSLTDAAAEKLLAYSWPGNVRELQNCIERAVTLTDAEEIGVEDLPERIRKFRVSGLFAGGTDPAALATLDEVERRYILHVLDAVEGNKTLAATKLGLDRKTLYRKLELYAREQEK
jgi:DNA-binding NtrC family response regulator